MTTLATEYNLEWTRDELLSSRRAAPRLAGNNMIDPDRGAPRTARLGMQLLFEFMREAKPIAVSLAVYVLERRPASLIVLRPSRFIGKDRIGVHHLLELSRGLPVIRVSIRMIAEN